MILRLRRFLLSFCALILITCTPSDKSNFVWQADNGNDTYNNPILWADYPDPDPIRVGDTFYMVSTSMHMMPGCPISKSTDLVNWEFAGYAVEDFQEHPFYNMEGGFRYARGPWASSIRYHKNKFHVCFNTNNEGFFMCIADQVEGPWTRHRFDRRMHDPGLFFDDDGRVYVAHGHKKIRITELTSDATGIKSDDIEVFTAPEGWNTFEGSHMYKIHGKYYVFNTWGGKRGKQAVSRADSIYGPYETKLILDDHGNPPDFPYGLHQGGILRLRNGDWWFVIFQDRDGVGRVPHLLPVRWEEGWPILGVNGKTVLKYTKPDVPGRHPVKIPVTSDEFDSDKLGLQWQWNHNPDNTRWSLAERPGFMRLKTAKVVNHVHHARNTLTQRVQGPGCIGTVKMDLTGMKEGDVAGLSVFQDPYGFIGVKRTDGATMLFMENCNQIVDSIPDFEYDILYIRAQVNCIKDKARMSYSTDNITWTPFGDQIPMRFSLRHFVGTRFALFNYATQSLGGHVDFDWFDFQYYNPGYPLIDKDRVDAEHYLAQSGVTIDPSDDADLGYQVTFDHPGEWIRLHGVDFGGYCESLELRMKPLQPKSGFDIILDDIHLSPLGSLHSDSETWSTASLPLGKIKGRHDVYLRSTGAAALNWIRVN